MAMCEENLFNRQANFRDRRLNLSEVSARIDDGACFRRLVPDQRAILLESVTGMMAAFSPTAASARSFMTPPVGRAAPLSLAHRPLRNANGDFARELSRRRESSVPGTLFQSVVGSPNFGGQRVERGYDGSGKLKMAGDDAAEFAHIASNCP